MKPRLNILVALVATCGVAGCTTGSGSGVCGPADLAPLATTPAYAVVTSDYTATAIGLLDANGQLITEAWVDSGTTQPGLVTALSGDVTTPTATVTAGDLTWIDRGLDSVTRVAVPQGTVLDQTSVVPPSQAGQAAYHANPQDVVADTGSQVWISRFEPNLDTNAPALDKGNDLVLANLATGQLTGRISLDSLDAQVQSGGMTVTAYARPSRMVAAGPRLVVGLARLSGDFQTIGPGAVAIVDTAGAGSATALDLTNLENCSEVDPVLGDDSRVLVACAGAPFGNESDRRVNAGVAVVHVAADGTATVDEVWHAADFPTAPVITSGLVSLGGTRVLGVAMGDTGGAPDRLVVLDLATGGTSDVYDAQDPYVLGNGVYDSSKNLVLWADADAGIVRFDVSGNTVTYRDAVSPSPCQGLPAREIRALQ